MDRVISFVTALDSAAVPTFQFVLEQSWRAAWTLPVVVFAAWLLRHHSARTRHALWWGWLATLWLPSLGFTSGWSLPTPFPVHRPPLEAGSPLTGGASQGGETAARDRSNATIAAAVPAPSRILGPRRVATMLWVLGASATVGFVLWSRRRVRALCRGSKPLPANLAPVLRRCHQRLGLCRRVRCEIGEHVPSPCLVGVLRPRILVPSALLDRLKPHEWEPVFLHELVHAQRRDGATLWLLHCTQVVFFFHPGVWLAARRLRDEREQCVDEAVLSRGGVAPMRYARSLLEIAEALRSRAARPLPLPLSPRARALAARLRRLQRPLPHGRALSAPLVFAATLGFGLAVGHAQEEAHASDPLDPAVTQLLVPHGLNLTMMPAKGKALADGHVHGMLVLDRDGTIATFVEVDDEPDERGFPPRVFVFPEDPWIDEEPPEWVEEDVVIEEGEIDVIEEIEELDGEIIELEEWIAIDEFGGVFFSSPTLTVHGPEPGAEKPRWSIDGGPILDAAALRAWAKQTFAADDALLELTIHGEESARFRDVASTIALLNLEAPKLRPSFGGVATTVGKGAKLLRAIEELELPEELDGEILVVIDHGSPWYQYAQAMQALGARGVSRIAFVAQHGQRFGKWETYLPTDSPLDR